MAGTTGPVVYKRYRNMQVVHAKPRFSPGSQTIATKNSAAKFGVASNLAMELRDNFASVISGFYDGPMVTRLNTDVLFSLRQSQNSDSGIYHFNKDSFDRLNGFEFNENSPLRNYLLVQPSQSISGYTLQIDLPELNTQNIRFPKSAHFCVLQIAVGMYDLASGYKKLILPVSSTEIKNDGTTNPAQQFQVTIAPGCLCLSVFALKYMRQTFAGQMILNQKSFSPAAIFKAVIADGIPDPAQRTSWTKIKFKTD